jgi:hypothetical protein
MGPDGSTRSFLILGPSRDALEKERAVRAAPGGSFPQLPVQRPVPSLNFDEVREAAPSSLTSRRAVRHAAQLLIILLDKILSTIERNY